MAPKRPSPLDEPPAASSSEVEETSSGEEEEGVSRDGSSSEEEEDDEETQTQTQTPKPKKSSALPSTPAVEKKSAPKKPEVAATNPQAQSSSSESGSESDSDTETQSGRNVKPMEQTPKVKKPSKPSASATPARSSLKRPSETTRDAKRPKKTSEADADAGYGVVAEDDSKKPVDESKKLFQRLWSEEDEIVILNGIIDYSSKKGIDPSMDMNAFHDFIKKSLHVDFSRSQLIDKIRRLRKKYRNNADRGKKGADPTFSKLHEQKSFQLSKKIWGGEGISGTPIVEQQKPNANGTPKKVHRGSTSKPLVSLKAELLPSLDALEKDDKMKVDDHEAPLGCMDGFVAFERSLAAVGLPESFLKPGLELIDQSKKSELEEEWKKLHLTELELFLKRTELIRDQAKLILEAYKSSHKCTK